MTHPSASFSESELRVLADSGLSITQIAEKLRHSRSATDRALRRYRIKTCGARPGRPAGVTEIDHRQWWAETAPWPIGIHFDSLTFKPSIQRKPVMPEANSGCGNSSAMVLG